jgi:hypothetical protein
MPNGQHNVGLTVDASDQYQLAGGNQGNGKGQNAVGQGAGPVQITLDAPAGYRIASVVLSGTGVGQIRFQVAGSGQSAVITNPCREPADVDYTVNVTSSNGATIPCHPKIVNT